VYELHAVVQQGQGVVINSKFIDNVHVIYTTGVKLSKSRPGDIDGAAGLTLL
jgi:hypothetical protein